MADGIGITPGSGATVATKDRGAIGHQQIVIAQPDVQHFQTSFSLTGDYAAGDCVGGKITIPNAARFSGGGGYIRDISVVFGGTLADGLFNAYLFSADPTASTLTNSSPLSIAAADLNKLIGQVGHLLSNAVPTGFQILSFSGGAYWQQLQQPYVCSGGTSLYIALMARVADTTSGTAYLNVFYSPL